MAQLDAIQSFLSAYGKDQLAPGLEQLREAVEKDGTPGVHPDTVVPVLDKIGAALEHMYHIQHAGFGAALKSFADLARQGWNCLA